MRPLLALTTVTVFLWGCSRDDVTRRIVDPLHAVSDVKLTVIENATIERLRLDTLLPDLVIGSGTHGVGDTLGVVTAVDADEKGRIYVFDQPAVELTVFSVDGRNRRTIVRSGGGPGELNGVRSIAVANDTVFLSGVNIQAIDTSGKFLEASAPHLSENVPYAVSIKHTDLGLLFHRVRPGEENTEYVGLEVEIYRLKLPDGIMPVQSFAERHYRYGERFVYPTILSPGLVWAPSRDGGIYYTVGDSFHINVADTAQALSWSIVGNVPPVSVKSSDIDHFGKSLVRKVYEQIQIREDIPEFSDGPILDRRPVIGQMLLDSQGMILLQRMDITPHPYDTYDPKGMMQWLLLDSGGVPIATFALPVGLKVARLAQCRIYGSTSLSDGTHVVHRYTIPQCEK